MISVKRLMIEIAIKKQPHNWRILGILRPLHYSAYTIDAG